MERESSPREGEGRAAEPRDTLWSLPAAWEESGSPGFPPSPHAGRVRAKETFLFLVKLFLFPRCEVWGPQRTQSLNKRLLLPS